MKKRLIIATFASFERFAEFSDQVRQTRRTSIPVQAPLPKDTAVVLYLIPPGQKKPFLLHGVVSMAQEGKNGLLFDDMADNMPLGVADDLPAVSAPPVKAVAAAPEEKGKEKREDKRMEWLREILSHEERILADEVSPDVPEETVADKNTLTPQEQELVAPAGIFIMNLTKAILRTGYYDPEHPGAQTAKRGLYDEFQVILRDSRELLLTKEESRGHEDIFITGILDAPVSIRTIVGKGVAELFVPKLYEYFEKKKLLSVAMKKQINADDFETFIAIMSNPEVDRTDGKDAAHILTHNLVENNITEISAVFVDDQLNFEKNLPWRVAMAMHRLAKDLKLLPMFKGVSTEAVRKLKQQSVQDIIRPLGHPELLNEFLINCYIIADHVEHMAPREIEQIIVNAFPARMLLPASQYTFAELEWLRQKAATEADNGRIQERLQGIKRILKMISQRIVLENITGGHNFLAYLYENEIVSFEELPADAQYVINTRSMAADVRENINDYQKGIRNAQTNEELSVYIDCFRRTAAVLIENDDWDVLQGIAKGLRETCAANEAGAAAWFDGHASDPAGISGETGVVIQGSAGSPDALGRMFAYIFSDQADLLVHVYENGSAARHHSQDDFLDASGYFGTWVRGRILCESANRQLRKQAATRLTQNANEARQWVSGVLVNPKHPWFVYRNAILILREVSRDPADADLVRPFLNDDHPRLRLEAVSAIIWLNPADTETLVINQIMDADSRVNWRAVKAVAELPELSENGMKTLLSMITAGVPEEPEAASVHLKHAARLITAIHGLPHIPNAGRVESEILHFVQSLAFKEKKKWHRLLKVTMESAEDILVLKVAVPLLGRIGGASSEDFLTRLERAHPELSEISQQAIQNIQDRETTL